MIALADNARIERRELETIRLRARLRDDAGVPIPLASITSWKVTHYCKDDADRTIIAARDAQTLVDQGVVASGLDGFFRYETDADDVLTAFFVLPSSEQAIRNPGLLVEVHVLQHEIIVETPDVPDVIRPTWEIALTNLGRVG